MLKRGQSALLGYDWEAALVDDSRQVGSRVFLEAKDEQLSELRDFRLANSAACIGPSLLSDLDAEIRGIEPGSDFSSRSEAETSPVKDIGDHVCFFPYEIEERLFAKPLTVSKDGSSVACPICGKGRPSALFAPSFVKVTLAKSRVEPPYIPRPRRRKSFDSSNSMSLASHLLQGSRPLRNTDVLPTTKSYGLRRNLSKSDENKKNKPKKRWKL